jgi:hypothetical protein
MPCEASAGAGPEGGVGGVGGVGVAVGALVARAGLAAALVGLGFALVGLGFAAARLGLAVVAVGLDFAAARLGAAAFATAGSAALWLSTGGAPAGEAARLSLRRWGLVRGSDPMTPGLGSVLMSTHHGAPTEKTRNPKNFVLSLKRRGRSEV